MTNCECPVCGSFVVESTLGNTILGRCFHCGYSWERNLFPFQEETNILKVEE